MVGKGEQQESIAIAAYCLRKWGEGVGSFLSFVTPSPNYTFFLIEPIDIFLKKILKVFLEILPISS